MMIRNKELRILKGPITFAEIAAAANVHQNTISRWFNDSEMNEVREGIVRNAINDIKKEAIRETFLDIAYLSNGEVRNKGEK